MSTINNSLEREPRKPIIVTTGPVFDKSVNIEPVKVELVTEIKESYKGKVLGAVLLFPKTESREEKRFWVSFDHLFASSPIELFGKFIDVEQKMFLGLTKVGVRQGQVFLAAA